MTTTHDDRERRGELTHVHGKPALRFERRYAQPIERVWRAVSDPDEMSSWFPSNVEGERAVGADLAFVDDAQRAAARAAGEPTRADGPVFRGRVVAWEPTHLFSFTWGAELLRFELFADGDGTRLVFVHVLSHQSIAARNGSGWHHCLDALERALGAGPRADESAEWRDVYDDYLDRMGPALATRSGTAGGGSLTWERATHVEPERVRRAVEDPTELEAWGAPLDDGGSIHWQVETAPTGVGTAYRVTLNGIGDDAELAARWHALLVQLDMYLAAGMLVPVEPKRWVDAYAELLS